MMPENFKDLIFPVNGLDVTTEFQLQPPGTCAVGVNARGFDPLLQRMRGGSRPGIDKYLPQQIPEGIELIQHLDVIVDPTSASLGQNFDVPEADWVEDPNDPGFFVPPGGWGYPGGAPEEASVALAFVQSNVTGYDNTAVEETTNFSTTPGSGNILLAIVCTGDNDLNTTATVKNGALNAFTQIGAYKRFTKLGVEFTLSLWYKIAADGASEQAVKVNPSSQADLVVGIMEFSGQNASPIGDTANNTGSAATMTTGSMTAVEGDCAIGAFLGGLAPDTVTPGAGFTLQIDHPDGSVDSTDIQLYVIYDLNRSAGAVNPEATFAGGADSFAALGLCIKD